MQTLYELASQYEVSEDDILNFRALKTPNMLIEFMCEENRSLLGSMFTAKTIEEVKEYQGRYKQNEQIISLIELIQRGDSHE